MTLPAQSGAPKFRTPGLYRCGGHPRIWCDAHRSWEHRKASCAFAAALKDPAIRALIEARQP